MAEEGTTAREAMRTPRSTWGWIGLLTGPIAWFAQLYGSWALGEVLACAPASRPGGEIYGLDMNLVAGLMNGALLAITIAAGVGSFLELRSVRRRGDPSPGDRAVWLARAGVMTSILFAAVIAVSFVPIGLIGSCE